jgi:hypothetical protein
MTKFYPKIISIKIFYKKTMYKTPINFSPNYDFKNTSLANMLKSIIKFLYFMNEILKVGIHTNNTFLN